MDAYDTHGRKLVDRMSEVNPGQRVIFLSDYSPAVLTTFGICPPGADILRKPFKEEDLRDRVVANLMSGLPWKALLAHSRGVGGEGSDDPSDSAASSFGLIESA